MGDVMIWLRVRQTEKNVEVARRMTISATNGEVSIKEGQLIKCGGRSVKLPTPPPSPCPVRRGGACVESHSTHPTCML